MKRLVFFIGAVLLTAILNGNSWAVTSYSCPVFPCAEGRDVLVPNVIIYTIRLPNKSVFDDTRPVYAANPFNDWLVRPQDFTAKMLEVFKMVKGDGDYWRANQMRYHPFLPCQLDDQGKPVYAKLNVFYHLRPQENGEKKLKIFTLVNWVDGKMVIYVQQ